MFWQNGQKSELTHRENRRDLLLIPQFTISQVCKICEWWHRLKNPQEIQKGQLCLIRVVRETS